MSTNFVSEEPNFIFKTNDYNSTVTFVSLVPANYTWMSCSSLNDNDRYTMRAAQVRGHRSSDVNIHTHTQIRISSRPCSLSHSNCEADSSWKEIPDASQKDSDVFCNKTIKSSLSRELVNGHLLKFCLTNSLGTWCKKHYALSSPFGQRSIGREIDSHYKTHKIKVFFFDDDCHFKLSFITFFRSSK